MEEEAEEDSAVFHPNVTVVGNTTYCWDEALQSYTWCQTEQLYSVPLSILLLLSFCYGAISLVAICGNLLVIGVVAFTRSMRTVTNLYIANLASADVVIAVFCIPFQFYAALLQRWDLPEFMCKFCPFAQTLSVNVSVFTLVTISIDRYNAIINPLSEHSSQSSARAKILGLWVFSVLLALPMLFFFEFTHVFDESNGGMKPFCTLGALLLQEEFSTTTQPEGENDPTQTDSQDVLSLNLTSEEMEDALLGPFQRISTFQTYNFLLSFVQYLLPLLAISFAYVRMGVRLWLTRTPGAAQLKRDQMILSNKKKTIKMLFTVVSIFGICWMPWHLYQISMILFPDINQYHYINIIFFISHWLAMSNSCYNPFIYAIYSEKFKREFRECAYCKCCQRLARCSTHGGIEDPNPDADFCSRGPDRKYSAVQKNGTVKSNSSDPANSIKLRYVIKAGQNTQHSPACKKKKSRSEEAKGPTTNPLNKSGSSESLCVTRTQPTNPGPVIECSSAARKEFCDFQPVDTV